MFTRLFAPIVRFVQNRKLASQGISACMCCKNHWGVVKMQEIPICETQRDLENLCATSQAIAPICINCFEKLKVEEIRRYIDLFCGQSVQYQGLDRMLKVRDLAQKAVVKMKAKNAVAQ